MVTATQSLGARRATIIDVAKLAGVSRQTVTRAMNEMPGISAATRKRVLEAANELRYRPSRFGRGLVKQGASTLGLVINDLTNPYYAELASHILTLATAQGWTVVITGGFTDVPSGKAGLEKLALQVDAVVGYLEPYSDVIEEVFGDMPVVSLEQSSTPIKRPSINIDFEPGIGAALDHLIASGRRNIVMLDRSPSGNKSERAESYERLYAARGYAPVVRTSFFDTNSDLASGVEAVRQLLVSDIPFDGIIAFNDLIAIGAIKHLQELGIAVPETCGVIGIDGIPIGGMVTPPLTTLVIDLEKLAASAVNIILGLAASDNPHGTAKVKRETTAHSLLVRASA